MSMMRASGAIPIITALQIATASFAVPKSVMKTIVGRVAVFFAASSEWFAWPPQPADASTAKSKIAGAQERLRKNCTGSPSGALCENISHSGIRWAANITHAGRMPGTRSTRRLRPLAILLVKLAMLVIRAGQLPLDEEITHLRLQFQRIAIRHNNVRKFSRRERTQLIRQSKHLRCIQHHRFQSLVVRQTVRHRGPGTRKRDRNSRRK